MQLFLLSPSANSFYFYAMNKLTLSLGTVSGLLILVGSLGPVLGSDGSSGEVPGGSLGYLMVLLAAVGAIVAMVIVARRTQEPKFGALVKTGLATAFVTALVYFVGSVVFYAWVSPDFLENLREAHIREKALTIADEAKRLQYLSEAHADKSTYANAFTYSGIQAVIAFMMCLMPVAVCAYVIFRFKSRRPEKVAKS